MAFEVFDRKAAPSMEHPFVTLQANGPLGLNKAAVEAIGNPAAIELLYDREERLIGIRPADPAGTRSYPVRAQGAGSRNYLIAAQAFSRFHGIDRGVARRYRATLQDGMLVIDLKDDAPIVTGPRAKVTPEPAAVGR